MRIWLGVWVGAGLLLGCGESEPHAAAAPGSGSRETAPLGDAGKKADAGKSTKDAGTASAAGAPVVDILAPMAMADPNADTILTDNMVTVRCKVTRSKATGAHEVNQGSVRIKAVGMDPKKPVAGVVVPGADNTFQADMNLAELPNGPVQFICEADDAGSPVATGKDTVDSFLDLGPTIEISEPRNKGSYALKAPVLVKFQVSASPINDDDKEATPMKIRLEVLGQSIDFTEDPGQPGLYTTNIDFNDRTVFPMAPSTAEVVVTAASSRTPDAPVRTVRSVFTLDAVGPTISVVSPPFRQVVPSEVSLVVMISDPSGVEQNSVVATVNDTLYTIEAKDWKVAGNMYSARFDTTPFGSTLTELTINIRASDAVGNVTTEPHMLLLDGQPPTVSLDPPNFREFRVDASKTYCSLPFDPVGDDAANDLEAVYVSAMYRVLVFENTNSSPGKNVLYHAGVKQDSVTLFVQKPNVPLLKDGNQDGVCDEINMMPDGETAPVQIALSPLSPRGTAFYSDMAGTSWTDAPDVSAGSCMASTEKAQAPPLCPATKMFRVIPQPLTGGPPAVYANSPTNDDKNACEGNTWELQSIAPSLGWVCLAARVEDNVKNVGISPAIRICLSANPSNPTECSGTPPTCMDNCKPPPDFKPTLLRQQ